MPVYPLQIDRDLYRRIAKRAKELEISKAAVFRRGFKRELNVPVPEDRFMRILKIVNANGEALSEHQRSLDAAFGLLQEISRGILKIDNSMKAAVQVLAEDIASNRREIKGLRKNAKKSV